MSLRHKPHSDADRAVSPVIGVILMVAITVILAAVIGTFVLTLGDDVDSTPNAQLSGTQENATMSLDDADDGDEDKKSIIAASIAHQAGDSIEFEDLSVTHNLQAESDSDGNIKIENAYHTEDVGIFSAGNSLNIEIEFDNAEPGDTLASSGEEIRLVYDNSSVLYTFELDDDIEFEEEEG